MPADASSPKTNATGQDAVSIRTITSWWPLLIIAVAVFAAYSSSFSGVFLLDDERWITGYEPIRQAWPLSVPMQQTNRPFGIVTFSWNYALHGYDVWGYHLVNVVLHLCNALLLFLILRNAFQSKRVSERVRPRAVPLALCCALIWSVHPLETQAVTYIVQRLESLMALWYLATLYCCQRATADPTAESKVWLMLSVICCALGMGTKEVMVSAPLIVLWYDRAFVADNWKQLVSRRKVYYLLLFATWGVLLWSLLRAQQRYERSIGNDIAVTPWTYLLTQTEVLVHYLRLVIWPRGLTFDYGWPVAESISAVWWQGLFIFALLVVTVWGMWRGRHWAILGGWFFLILAPSSSFVPIIDLAFEHRMYLPSMAVIVVLVLGGMGLIQRFPNASDRRQVRRFSAGVVAVFAVVLCVLTYQRNQTYHDALTMWQDTLYKAPGNPRALILTAKFSKEQGHFEQALGYYRRFADRYAGGVHPQYDSTFFRNQLGVALMISRDMTDPEQRALAENQLETALQYSPTDVDPYLNLGTLYRPIAPERSLGYYRKALELEPENLEAMLNLGGTLVSVGQPREGLDYLQRVLERAPDHPVALTEIAIARISLGNVAGARRVLQRVLQLQPNNPQAMMILQEISAE